MTSYYRITVKGRLSAGFATELNQGQEDDDGNTILTGPLIDQSQLHGIINHLHDLGIAILRFETTDDDNRQP